MPQPAEVVSEPEAPGTPSHASRNATGQYRTAPLTGLWQHARYLRGVKRNRQTWPPCAMHSSSVTLLPV